MKKIKYIDLIRAEIDSLDKTRKIHPIVIEHEISTVYNDMIVSLYANGLVDMNHYARKYGLLDTVKVLYNNYTKEYYSLLPEEMIPLPDPNAGIVEILTKESMSLVFVPMTRSEFKMIENLECRQIDEVIGYTFYTGQAGEYGRIVYNGMTSAIAAVGVVMSLLIPFHAYADDDFVYFPSGQEQRIKDTVLQRLGIIPPPDLVNNNSDAKRVRQ
jgi:hypothetical protein